jgi:hypothetical protein
MAGSTASMPRSMAHPESCAPVEAGFAIHRVFASRDSDPTSKRISVPLWAPLRVAPVLVAPILRNPQNRHSHGALLAVISQRRCSSYSCH